MNTGTDKKPLFPAIRLFVTVCLVFCITLTSWASIFTGKLPKETGILGNEFFARDLTFSVPSRFNNPTGIITFASGAFKGFDQFGLIDKFTKDFIVPYQASWKDKANSDLTPQNDPQVLISETIFQTINNTESVKKYHTSRGSDAVVVEFSHYSRGAYRLTWDIEIDWSLSESKTLDKMSWEKLNSYLTGKYTNGILNMRNNTPFSALTIFYLPGLDHEAHDKGLGIYKNYFINTTDQYINKLVEKLKNLDEFNNKIFIITADHGHTEMPTIELPPMSDEEGNLYKADTSCKLNLKDFDKDEKKYPELANNNLHIWELAEVMKAVGSIQNTAARNKYKVLAPKEIADLFVDSTGQELSAGATNNLENAQIIAALNGPMAHIYVQNTEAGQIAEILRLMLQTDDAVRALQWLGLEELDYNQIRETGIGKIKSSIDKILIRIAGNYCVFDGLNDDGTPRCFATDPFTPQEYVKAWERINGMNNINRSGDIVLIMKDSSTGSATDRYTTGVACKSWHGSLNKSDSYVPFIVAYPGGNKNEIEPFIAAVCPNNTCEGNWKLAELIKEIIKSQYSGQ